MAIPAAFAMFGATHRGEIHRDIGTHLKKTSLVSFGTFPLFVFNFKTDLT